MKEQRITIEITPEGRMTADAHGFSGDACLRDLDRLLEGLTAGIESVERKPGESTARIAATLTQTTGKKR